MTDLAHRDRLDKVAALRAAGIDPYPARGVRAEPIERVLADAGTADEKGQRAGEVVQVAGRLLTLRDFGKLIFAHVLDRTGTVQVALQKDRLGDWWPQRKFLDGGDWLTVRGELGHTQKGEITVWADEVQLLAKSVAPPPEKHHGLTDVEARYRRRYVDLWAGENGVTIFVQRSRIVSFIRRYLEAEAFIEVETPTLHPVFGGATARPFVTHHNALDADLYLRIAPELYLKRLIVGGLERVFEFARVFRNEGLSTRHNPEFTMLELYEAQADYTVMMERTEAMIEGAAREIHGDTLVQFRGTEFDLAAPFQRRRYTELFREHNGFDYDDEEAVKKKAAELGIPAASGGPAERWKLMNDVFEATVEDHLSGPVFVTDYPAAICPLAKKSPGDEALAERFELFIDGMEIANAFTELNDPADQERRFVEQVASKDPETPGEVDVDYVQALEYGMPPTGGLGIGIDRLVMVLTGQESIREVILFPALRSTPAGVGASEEEPEVADRNPANS